MRWWPGGAAGAALPHRRRQKPKRRRTRIARPRRGGAAARTTEAALANLAHDIRTPLTGILALSELLVASDLPERERRWAAAVRDAASHLARLTTLVIDAAKPGQRKLTLRAEPFDLRELVDAAAQSLTARAEGKALEAKISIPRNLPGRVTGDAVRLRSALENLIDNAVRFTERGRVALTVTAAAAPRDRLRLTFRVADTGIGIVPADLRRLFRPFVQANAQVARRFGGSGLGLAFVRRMARAMGGDLTATSEPGRGSTFQLAVLVRRAAADRAGSAARRRAPRRLRILSVEDSPYGRVVLNTLLGEFGHRVAFAGSGEAALDALRRDRYDVVLLDTALPGIDGFETVRRMRALPEPSGRVPVIGISGRSEPGDAAAARAAGMQGYLGKPVSPRELYDAIAEALRAGGAD